MGEPATSPISRFARARSRFGIPALLVLLTLLLVGSASGGALPAPVPTTPNNGSVVDSMPAFGWNPVSGAADYEFQISADSGFNSPVLGQGKDDFRTRNTRATLIQTAPNGTYWWRVRAISSTGAVSPWSHGRSFTKSWGTAASLISPVGGAAVVYPTSALRFTWSNVPRARKYQVSIGTDPDLGSLVTINGQQQPVETSATSLTPALALAQGTYYWAVTPIDAEGNKGARSAVASFRWTWPSATTPQVSDLVADAEVFDPRFTWDRVPGAARYEVEVNPSIDFAAGSKVCCTGTTINTSLSPTMVLPDNAYYWRVRAIDMDGNAGVWNVGPTFTKTFDNVPPTSSPSIKGLRMRDNVADPGTDTDPGTAGYQTQVPVLTWNPVPGASSYQVDVTPFNGTGCVWSAPITQQFTSNIALNSWTPLGSGWNLVKPYSDPHSVATELLTALQQGPYCARVRARSDRTFGTEVYGDYTYLDCSTLPCTARPDDHGWAFQWTGYPAGGSCTPSCNTGYLGASDYQLPFAPDHRVAADGVFTVGETPLFTWRPVAGASSYFVLVARDANFTNIVDYAFTQLPVYAPRATLGPTTYPDEVTRYYWAVLPEAGMDGGGVEGNPLAAAPQNFYKQSTPPQRTAPTDGSTIPDQPVFQWTPVTGARTYRLEVSQDPSFANPIEDVTTDSTSFASNTTYPADTVLYWRVRANDENSIGLAWSTAGAFQKTLARPDGSGNATQGDAIPTWTWTAVPGAVSYDISADLPDGRHTDLMGFRTPAFTPTIMYGTGIFHWRVRAEFPKAPYGLTPGPWSTSYPFTKTIREPSGAHAEYDNDRLVLVWDPKPGAKRYRVQLSGTEDFSQPVENVLTDNTSYAPLLRYLGYRTLNTGRLYWRVAAIDEGDNLGDYTQPQLIIRTPRMAITVRGSAKHGKRSTIVITVSNLETSGWLQGATVRVAGAGIRARRGKTNTFGSVSIAVRPSRRGAIIITATKRGYRKASLRLGVR